jgi:hypothetical protein
MQIARSPWIVVTLGSTLALALVGLAVGEARAFLLVELVLFTVAFLLARLLGGPGKVLALGAGLGLAFATLAALATSGNCSESDLICFSPGETFAIGLIVSGGLYPGWALGAGAGALVRGTSDRRSNR